MVEFLIGLFDAGEFARRSQCGDWSTGHVVAAETADAMIALAYFSIPISLTVLWRHHRVRGRNLWIVMLFAGFITLCGMTHLCQVMAFHWPAYRLFTAVSAATAVASIATAIVLPTVVSDSIVGSVINSSGDLVSREVAARAKLEASIERIARESAELQLSAERTKCEGLLSALAEARMATKAHTSSQIENLSNLGAQMHSRRKGDNPDAAE